MILICGYPSEPVVAILVQELDLIKADYILWNPAKFKYTRIDLSINEEGILSGILVYENIKYKLEEFSALYAAVPDWKLLPEIIADPSNTKLRRQCESVYFLLQTFIDNFRGIIIEGNNINVDTRDIVSHLQSAPQDSIKIPVTLLTTSPEAAAKFHTEHSAQVIYKSVCDAGPVVQHAETQDAGQFSRLFYCPVEFRELIGGYGVYIYVINLTVKAFSIDNQSSNRISCGFNGGAAQVTLTEIKLSEEDEKALLGLCSSLGLFFCRIDARIDREQRLYISPETMVQDNLQGSQDVLRSVLNILAIELQQADEKFTGPFS